MLPTGTSRGTHLLGTCRRVKARMGEDRERRVLGNIPLIGSVRGMLWGSWTIQAKKSGVWYALWGSYLRVQSGTPWEVAGLFITRAIMGIISRTSSGGSDSKESAYNAGDLGLIPRRIPWRRKWQPTSVFLSEKFHGQKSLAGYSPWDCKELDPID